jgi:hypothetical protein
MSHVAPADAIERFAEICALLDNGSSPRDEILAAAGLDAAGWRLLCVQWLPQLAAGDAPELSLSFAPAYARARRYPGGLVLPHASPVLRSAVPAELDEEDTEADAASPVGLDPDRTVAGSFPLAGPALPFRAATVLPPALTTAPSEAPPAMRPAAEPAEATLQVACAAPAPSAVLPFSAPTADGRLLRLQRFDTSTGELLAVPRWVDDADIPAPPG